MRADEHVANSNQSAVADRLLAIVVGVGAALRLNAFINQRSLWLDEARLALNISSRSFTGLLKPLDYDQSAPPLFLWAEKLMTLLFGVNELALRAIPLISGLLALALIYPVSRRVLTPAGARLATAAFALSPTLIFYSNELKQYGVDVAVTLILLKLAQDLVKSGGGRNCRRRLLVAGMIAPWVSAPALFVLCGIGLAVLGDQSLRRALGVWPLARAGAAWAISFGLVYYAVYRAAAGSTYLTRYWATSNLAPWGPGFPEVVWRQIRFIFWGVLLGHAGPIYASGHERLLIRWAPTPLVILGLVGAFILLRRQPRWAAILVVGPILALCAASIVQAYPIALRMTLFAAPLLIILVSAACERGVAALAPNLPRAGWVATGLLLLSAPFATAIEDALRPTRPQHTRPLIEEFQRLQTTEPIYVYAAALPAWAFYTTDWTRPDTARLTFLRRIGTSGGAAFENAPSRGRPVRAEGDGLTREYNDWVEIYGVPTGMEWSAGHQVSRQVPDPCWADHEVARMRRAASPGAWLLISHVVGPELELLDRLDSLGGREAYRREEANSGLLRYEFVGGETSPCEASEAPLMP